VTASLMTSSAIDDSNGTIFLANDLNPLNNGFMLMFKISSDVATILSIPATYATAFGFIFAFGRVILAMAKSSLFPPVFTRTCGRYESPYVAILAGSVIGYILCIVVYFVPSVATYLFNYCILSGFVAYISQFIGFILFRVRHSTEKRLFVSPLGIPGAVYGIVVFSMASISVMGFQNDQSIAFIAFLVGIIIYSTYYFLYAKKRQRFSPEEKFIFVLQIVKCKWILNLNSILLTLRHVVYLYCV
jgi:ethanolamine permease